MVATTRLGCGASTHDDLIQDYVQENIHFAKKIQRIQGKPGKKCLQKEQSGLVEFEPALKPTVCFMNM